MENYTAGTAGTIGGTPPPQYNAYSFTIKGRLPGLNEYIKADRTNPYSGAKMKKNAQALCEYEILSQLKRTRIDKPVQITYRFFEMNKRRDHDNVSGFAHKVIQDALVKRGILLDDGWDEITGYTDLFFLDKENPRIEVILQEVCEIGV